MGDNYLENGENIQKIHGFFIGREFRKTKRSLFGKDIFTNFVVSFGVLNGEAKSIKEKIVNGANGYETFRSSYFYNVKAVFSELLLMRKNSLWSLPQADRVG